MSTISIGAPISGMAVDAPGAHLIVLLEDRNRILFVDTSTFQIVRMVGLGLPNGVTASFVTIMPGAGVVYLSSLPMNPTVTPARLHCHSGTCGQCR